MPQDVLLPLNPKFGLVIETKNMRSICSERAAYFKNLLYQNKVLVFNNVDLTPEEYLGFAKLFGQTVKFVDVDYRHPDYPEIFVVSNVLKEGKKFGMDRVGYYWHSDSSFMPEPLPITMLYSQIVPEAGGETAFIDMGSVYQNLQSHLGDTDSMFASHEGKWRYLVTNDDVGLSVEEILERDESLVPSQVHPLVFRHPITGEKVLYFSQGITRKIIGMPELASRSLLSKISNAIELDSSQYKHTWQENQIVIWDNRSVVHRAFPSATGQSRLMFRIGVNDGDFFKS